MTKINTMTDYLENSIINHIFRSTTFTPSANVYLGLYSTQPGENTAGTEITGGGYTRIQCPEFSVSGGVAVNPIEIKFPIATSTWGTVGYMGISTASAGGNLLFYGELWDSSTELFEPISISNGEIFSIGSGSLSISLRGNEEGGWGDSTATSILKFVLNNDTYVSPGLSVYMALGRAITTNPLFNLLSWLEVTGGGYSRKQIGGTANWIYPVGGITDNINEIIFTENATTNWGNIIYSAFFNSSSGGDPLLWGLLTPSIQVLTGDGIRFRSGTIDIDLDTPQTTTAVIS